MCRILSQRSHNLGDFLQKFYIKFYIIFSTEQISSIPGKAKQIENVRKRAGLGWRYVNAGFSKGLKLQRKTSLVVINKDRS